MLFELCSSQRHLRSACQMPHLPKKKQQQKVSVKVQTDCNDRMVVYVVVRIPKCFSYQSSLPFLCLSLFQLWSNCNEERAECVCRERERERERLDWAFRNPKCLVSVLLATDQTLAFRQSHLQFQICLTIDPLTHGHIQKNSNYAAEFLGLHDSMIWREDCLCVFTVSKVKGWS